VDKLDKTGGDWNTKMTSFKDKIVGVLHAVIDAVAEVATDFAMLGFTLVTSALNYVGDNWDSLGASVTKCLQGVAEALKKYAQPIIDAVFDILNAAIEGITYAITSVKGAILLENIRFLGKTIGLKLYDGIKEALKDTKLGEYLFALDETAFYKTYGKNTNANKDKIAALLNDKESGMGTNFLKDLEDYNKANKELKDLKEKEEAGTLTGDEFVRLNTKSIKYGDDMVTLEEYVNQMESVVDSYVAVAAQYYGTIEDGLRTQAENIAEHEAIIKELQQQQDQENYENAKTKAEEEWKTKLPELQKEKQTLESGLEFLQKSLEEETGPAVVRSAKAAAIDYQQYLIDNINKEIEAGPQIDYTPLYSNATETAETTGKEMSDAQSTGIQNEMDVQTPDIRKFLYKPFELTEQIITSLITNGATVAGYWLQGAKSKEGFDSHSPSKAMIRIMNDVGEGMLIGTKAIEPLAEDSGAGLGESIVGSMDSAIGNIDFEDTGAKIIDGLKDKLPAKEEFTGLFGLDKGIAGNIQGLKTAWGKIKGIFSGDFNISDIFTNLLPGDMDINNLVGTFGTNFDTSSFGYSDTFMTDKSWENALANFDPNTMMTTDTLNLNLNINDTELQELNKSMSTGVDWNAVTGGYNARGGTTYNYNYNYIQNNTSSGALNTRELNRTTQLALTRNRWRVGGGG